MSRLPAVRPLIYLISAGNITSSNFDRASAELLDLVRTAVDRSIPLIQIREKQLGARQLCELTGAAVAAAAGSSSRILVNDRADVAVAAGADGVHLAESSVPVAEVRRLFGSRLLIGASRHSVSGVLAARDEGADLATFGPVFATPGKGEPVGVAALRECVEAAGGFPVIALGGIDESNFRQALAAGAAGFAAIRSLHDREMLKRLGREFYSKED